MGNNYALTYAPRSSELREELWAANQELQDAYAAFNMVSDPELVEACVYQISALRARCNYLLRRLKALQPPEQDACAAASLQGGAVCRL